MVSDFKGRQPRIDGGETAANGAVHRDLLKTFRTRAWPANGFGPPPAFGRVPTNVRCGGRHLQRHKQAMFGLA